MLKATLTPTIPSAHFTRFPPPALVLLRHKASRIVFRCFFLSFDTSGLWFLSPSFRFTGLSFRRGLRHRRPCSVASPSHVVASVPSHLSGVFFSVNFSVSVTLLFLFVSVSAFRAQSLPVPGAASSSCVPCLPLGARDRSHPEHRRVFIPLCCHPGVWHRWVGHPLASLSP